MPNAEVVPWRAGSPGLVPGGRWPSSTARRNRSIVGRADSTCSCPQFLPGGTPARASASEVPPGPQRETRRLPHREVPAIRPGLSHARTPRTPPCRQPPTRPAQRSQSEGQHPTPSADHFSAQPQTCPPPPAASHPAARHPPGQGWGPNQGQGSRESCTLSALFARGVIRQISDSATPPDHHVRGLSHARGLRAPRLGNYRGLGPW